MSAKRYDLFISNERHHVEIMMAVIPHLLRDGAEVRIVSLCELRGILTPRERLVAAGCKVVRLFPFGIRQRSSSVIDAQLLGDARSRRLVRQIMWWGFLRYALRVAMLARPAAVALPNIEAFPCREIGSWLNTRGIPFVLIQEGIRFHMPGLPAEVSDYNVGARAIAVWGKSSRDYFVRFGARPESIYCVGNPRIPVFPPVVSPHEATSQLLARAGIIEPFLLVASNPVDNLGFCSRAEKNTSWREFFESAQSTIRKHRLRVVFKLHPSESVDDARNALQGLDFGSEVIVTRDGDLPFFFSKARAVIVWASSVGLEALLHGLPLGILPVPGHGYLFDYVEKQVGIPLRPGPGIDEQIQKLLDGLSADSDQRRFQYLVDNLVVEGNAGHAIAALLAESPPT